MKIEAYHFIDGHTLRDGTKAPRNGKWLRHPGAVVMCESGLHASRHPFDALTYAPGATLCKVLVCRDVQEDKDKLVARERVIVARIDATALLRRFARRCALDVLGSIPDAPEILVQYLKTGDESIRSAARNAAWSAAENAAESAARSAAERAARSAAESAAESAAWSAARNAAWSAAESAAWSAARSAARSAAERAARSAAERAARSAARSAAWKKQRKRFAGMVRAEFRKIERKTR